MDYSAWRSEIFGTPPGTDPVSMELPEELYSLSPEESFDHIDRALVDAEIHELYSKEQSGIALQLIYSNSCSDLPFCYTQAGDEARRIRGIGNLRHLYANFFDRYCVCPVKRIGCDLDDGDIGFVCYMLWDIFVLYPDVASPGMTDAALEVMAGALESKNDHSIVSAIHGLGHWAADVPQASAILQKWLENPATENTVIHDYARQAATGCIQ